MSISPTMMSTNYLYIDQLNINTSIF